MGRKRTRPTAEQLQALRDLYPGMYPPTMQDVYGPVEVAVLSFRERLTELHESGVVHVTDDPVALGVAAAEWVLVMVDSEVDASV